MSRVLITTVPFGLVDRTPLDLLERYGIDYVINPLGKKLLEDELIDFVGDCEVIIAGTEQISKKTMNAAKNLRLISRVGIGLDSVDLLSAEKMNIAVSYTPDAPAPAVADLTIGLMYSLSRKIHLVNMQMHSGSWYRHFGKRLEDSVVGIIGAGRVGSRVIKTLSAIGCKKILYYDQVVDLKLGKNVIKTSKNDIYKESDIVSLHIPLDLTTRGMITLDELNLMKPEAFIINTSRGGIILEEDLETALATNLVAGAAVDVFNEEPYNGSLKSYENCILTSHMGSMSFDCRVRMEIEATKEAINFLTNEKQNSPVPQQEYILRKDLV